MIGQIGVRSLQERSWMLLGSPWKSRWEMAPVGGQPVCLLSSLCALCTESCSGLRAPSPLSTVLPVPCTWPMLHTLIQLSPTPPWGFSKPSLHLDTPTSSYAPYYLGFLLAKFGACEPVFDPVSALSPLYWSSLRTMTASCHFCTPSGWHVPSS